MVLVQHILDHARARLAILSEEATVAEAAEVLARSHTPLAVVCDCDGIAVGVISRTDIIRAFSRGSSDVLDANAGSIMTTPVFACHADQTLQSVWSAMNTRSFRCAPVLDSAQRPQGVVHARDLARVLLDDVTNEEIVLRDYVLGVGYQ